MTWPPPEAPKRKAPARGFGGRLGALGLSDLRDTNSSRDRKDNDRPANSVPSVPKKRSRLSTLPGPKCRQGPLGLLLIVACGFGGRARGIPSILPKKTSLIHDSLLQSGHLIGVLASVGACANGTGSLCKNAHFSLSYSPSKCPGMTRFSEDAAGVYQIHRSRQILVELRGRVI